MIKNLLIISSLLMASCTHLNTQNKEASLFERIGGIPVLNVVVAETIDQVSQDPALKRSFKDIKLSTLKQSVVNQLCLLTGGECKYEGDTMKKSHASLKITTAEFELFVEAFRDALNRHVATREKNELLKILAPMKRDIVADPSQP